MLSDILYIPLADAKARPLKTNLLPGAVVLPDQVLAFNNDTTVHAPYGGTILSIVMHPMIYHRPLLVETLVIKVEHTLPAAAPANYHSFGELLIKSGIVGLGGAGFSTARKLSPSMQYLLLNAMECEPLINADAALMLKYPDKIIQGIHALQSEYPEAIVYFCMEAGKDETLIARLPKSVQVKIMPAEYPSGAERTLVKSVLKIQLAAGVPASEHGILCLNIGTVAAIGDAIQGKPLTHRMVTIADTVNNTSTDTWLPIGIPIGDILMSLNIDVEGKRISQGGKYMPTLIHDMRSPLMKTSNCILIEEDTKREIMPCIRCSACIPVCPEQLLPQQLYWHLKDDDLESASKLNLEACIACGACDAVCPSQIPLASLFSYGKESLSLDTEEKRLRALAQSRFHARESRKARLAELREEKREVKRVELTRDDKKRAIEEALARVKMRDNL